MKTVHATSVHATSRARRLSRIAIALLLVGLPGAFLCALPADGRTGEGRLDSFAWDDAADRSAADVGDDRRDAGSDNSESAKESDEPQKEDGSAADSDGARAARADTIRRHRIGTWVRDLTKLRHRREEAGLQVSANFVPDLLAFDVARRYTDAREEGKGHAEAIELVREAVAKGDSALRRRSLPGFQIELENSGFKPSGAPAGHRRIFTTEERFPRGCFRVVGITEVDGRQIKRAVRFELAEKPRKLRAAKVRIKKFWKVRGRARREAGRVVDPNPVLEPVLSDPIPAVILEEGPASVALRVSPKVAGLFERFEVRLGGWKRFEGPFRDDQIDLNEGRKWKELERLTVTVRPPPAGSEVPPPVRDLVDAVTERSRESGATASSR